MPTMNISLPERMREYVERQVESGKYSSSSEYIRELIRLDERARAREKLESLLVEGLESGDASALDAGEFEAIRREAAAQFAERARKG